MPQISVILRVKITGLDSNFRRNLEMRKLFDRRILNILDSYIVQLPVYIIPLIFQTSVKDTGNKP